MSAQVPLIDTSFGFTSAVEAAIPMIEAANTEAEACPNGIGIVKLMGRHSGFIALHATCAAEFAGGTCGGSAFTDDARPRGRNLAFCLDEVWTNLR